MAVTVLDLITGSVRPLSQLTGIAANVMVFEMQAGGTRALSEIIARPDTLKLFDMTSRAQLTYNQALAADGGGNPPVGFGFVTTSNGVDFVTTNNGVDRVIARAN